MLQRTLQNYLLEASQTFPVLLLTGPRQVGKTTLLKSLASKDMNYVTMDDLDARLLAQTDPVVFLNRFKTPMIIY
jgi:predicted AAA+ superfamily ATPase